MNSNITIGATVKRIPGDRWSKGDTGQVIEIDDIAGRARVLWTTRNNPAVANPEVWKPKRTWIKLTNLERKNEMIATIQFSTQQTKAGRTVNGHTFAVAAAKQIAELGHSATAHPGPASIQSPDDEDRYNERFGHVRTTEAGKAALAAWKVARKAA